jgi:hypothetical protein
MAPVSWPITIGLGLGVVLAIGGVVNVARIAFALTVWIIATIGFLFFVFTLQQTRPSSSTWLRKAWAAQTRSERIETLATVTFIVLIVVFAVATQLPPDVFNFDDDLRKYFTYPVRQLATGTLFGSPLSALGSETLGGIAFLQSFVVSIFPLQYINGVDAVFGLALLMTLGAAAGWRRMNPLPGALLAPLLIACIEPLYANVSALYLGSFLIATAVMLTVDLQDHATDRPSPLAMGLIYGGLIALKPTFAIFPALHLPFVAIAFSVADGLVRHNIKWALRVALWTTVFLAPWIVLHAPHYLSASHIVTEVPADGVSEHARLFYALTATTYATLVGLAILTIALGLIRFWKIESKNDRCRGATLIAAGFTAIMIYGIFLFVLSPICGVGTSIRYSIPLLIGIIPILVVLSAGRFPNWPNLFNIGIPVISLVAVTLVFTPSLLERYYQAIEYRTIFASGSATDPVYREYIRVALSTSQAEKIQKMQRLIPEKEPFLAWISQPFHLDFNRNPVLDIEPAGLATSWALVPPFVQYVMWEYRGYGVESAQEYLKGTGAAGWLHRLMYARSHNFMMQLNAKVQKGTILFSDENFVVVRLSSP